MRRLTQLIHRALMIVCLITTSVPLAVSAVEYQSWQDPAGTDPQPGADLRTLLEELTRLVDAADRSRAADPRLLQDLRALIRRYDWPWQLVILDEDFTDGRVGDTPKWRVTAGSFRAEHGVGLTTSVEAVEPAKGHSQSSNQEDLAAALLNQLLKQATKPAKESGETTQPAPASNSAEIHVATPIANAFALSIVINARDQGGRFAFGVFQGSPGGAGYRVVYQPRQQPALELQRITSRGIAVIEKYAPVLAEVNDGNTIQWTRDITGAMAVAFNGREAFRVTDRGLNDAFSGFAMSNLGGSFAIKSIKLQAAR